MIARFAIVALVIALVAAVALVRRRARDRAWAPAVGALRPADVPGGLAAPLTALYFTSPLCAACRDTPGIVRDAAPEVPVVGVSVRDRPDLVRRLALVETPTLLLLDAQGRIRYARAGNPDAAELWTYAREAWDSLDLARP